MSKTAMTRDEIRNNKVNSQQQMKVLKRTVNLQQKKIAHLASVCESAITDSKSNGLFPTHLATAAATLSKELEGDNVKNNIKRDNKQVDMMRAVCISDMCKKSGVTSIEELVRLGEIGKNEGLFFASANSYKSLAAKLTIIFDTTAAANLTIGVSNDDAENVVAAIKQWARQNRRNLSNYLRFNVTEIPSAPPTEMIGSINDDGEIIAYAQDDGAYYPLSELGNDVFQNYCALLEDYNGKPCIPRNQKARVIEFLLTEIADELTPGIEGFLDSKLDEYEHQADDGQLIDDPFEFLHSLTPDAPDGFSEMIEYLQLKDA